MKEHETKSMTEKSIAVLPFVNLSNDPDNEYFSDGMTEEIINALTGIRGLKVIARTSSFMFKGKSIDVRTIGKQLAVATILEGSVRKAENRVRISAQLIDTNDGSHIWSKNIDRELNDIFLLQDEVSMFIAERIRENFGHLELADSLVDNHTQSVEAYNLYLQGRFNQLKWNTEGFQKAIKYYKESILIDPTYPMPYYGLIQCYTSLFMWRSIKREEAVDVTKVYLEMVKNINNSLPEYHLARSSCAVILNWDLKLGYSELKSALDMNASNVDALESLAGLFIVTGHFNEGLRTIDQALKLNPLSATHNLMKGNILYYSGEYENAIVFLDKALSLDSDLILATQIKMACLLLLKDKRALTDLINSYSIHPFSINFKLLSDVLLDNKKLESKTDFKTDHELLPWALYAHVYMKENAAAVSVLKQGLLNRNGQYFCYKYDPLLDSLRSDEAYINALPDLPDFSIELKESEDLTDSYFSKRLSLSEIEEITNSLKQAMEDQMLFLDPQLTLKSLADSVDIHPNVLSWFLNEKMKMNFNEYVNSYRLETFKVKALDKANTHLTLLALAYESGFNSKTVFNAFFKKKEKLTPRAWIKENDNK